MEDIRPLLKERLHNLHRSRNRVAYFVPTIIFFISLYIQNSDRDPGPVLFFQIGLMCTGLLIRVLVYEKFFKIWKEEKLWVRYLNVAGFLLLASAWGLHFVDIYLHYGPTSANVSYTMMIMVGYIAVAANTLTASRESYLTFVLPLALSVIGCHLLLSRSPDFTGISIMLLFLFISLTHYRVLHRQLIELISSQITSHLEKERLKSIINTVPGFAGIFRKDGVCTIVNESALNLYPDIVGKKIGQIDPTSKWESFILDFLASPRSFDVAQHSTSITGTEIHVLINIQKMEDGNAIVISVINTELVHARNKLRLQEAQSQYTAKLVSLGEMAAGIAHEVNNPLTIILGSANIVKKIADQDPVDRELLKTMADKIVTTSGRITRTIKSMRSLSRIADNDPMTNVSLKEVLDMVLDVSSPHLRNHGVELRLAADFHNVEVLGREIQISQVFMNLLNNAVDATKDQNEKWIEIKTVEEKDSVTLLISDSGPGIPKELHKKIMEPFFTTKDVNQGTGLGLSISRKIMQDHGGDLRLLPESPKTTFQLKFRKPSSSQE